MNDANIELGRSICTRVLQCGFACVCGEIILCNDRCRTHLTPVTLRTTVDLHVSEVVRLVGKLGTA